MPPWASPIIHTIQYSVSDRALGRHWLGEMIDVPHSVFVHIKMLEDWLMVAKEFLALYAKFMPQKKKKTRMY